MKKPSTRFLIEIEGYAFGLTFIGGLIGSTWLIQAQTFDQGFKNILNMFDLLILTMFAWMYRNYVIGLAKNDLCHVAQVFENEKNAWVIEAMVERIIPISPKDQLYADAMKPFDLQNRYFYLAKYSHVTTIGNNRLQDDSVLDFEVAGLFTDTPIDELYGHGIPYETFQRGFATPVTGAFLVFDLLRTHPVDEIKGVMKKQTIPVFNVRKGHIHSRYDKRFQDLPQADVRMLESKEIITIATTVNLQKNLIEAKAEGFREGMEIGKQQGSAAIKRYKQVGEQSVHIPNVKAHFKAYTIVFLGVLVLVAGYLLGWIKL